MARRTGSQDQRRGQQQGRARGRERTKVVRAGLADWELPPEHGPLPGPAPGHEDLGRDEEADGDQFLDDAEDTGTEALALAPDEDEAGADLAGPGMTLRSLIGSRPPVVLLRLTEEDRQIRARACATPPSENAQEALEELRLFVERLFQSGRAHFTLEEWDRLLGAAPAALFDRLLLLSRLAISGSAKVVVTDYQKEQAAEGAGGPAGYQFTPNDRGLERYVNKFAALPDGTPFGIRLLLLDERGRKAENPNPLQQLPAAVKLEVLRRALEAEAQAGKADTDNAFRDRLQEALRSLGIDQAKPTEKHVQDFRQYLKRNDLGHLFPNAQERQRAYERSASLDRPEESA
jgi:hypothetical protein